MVKAAGTGSTYVPPEIDAGLHLARFESVEEKVIPSSQFDPESFEWTFTILNADGSVMYDEGEPIVLNGLTSRSFNVKSKTVPKAVKWLKALTTAPEFAAFVAAADGEGEGFDTDDLIGRKVNVIVAINDENGRVKVTDLIAIAQPKAGGKNKPGSKAADSTVEGGEDPDAAKAAARAALEAQLAALG